MGHDLTFHFVDQIIPKTDYATHIALSHLNRQTHACYASPFLVKLCRLNGIAMPAVNWDREVFLLSVFIGTNQHTTRTTNPCNLRGYIDLPFEEGDQRLHVVLDKAYLKAHPKTGICLSALCLADCVWINTVQDNVLHYYSSLDTKDAKLHCHTPVACRFLTIPPVNDLVIQVLSTWHCHIQNPARVTMWDAQATINKKIWEMGLTGKQIRKLAEDTFKEGYEYGKELFMDKVLEEKGIDTLGTFIHYFMKERPPFD